MALVLMEVRAGAEEAGATCSYPLRRRCKQDIAAELSMRFQGLLSALISLKYAVLSWEVRRGTKNMHEQTGTGRGRGNALLWPPGGKSCSRLLLQNHQGRPGCYCNGCGVVFSFSAFANVSIVSGVLNRVGKGPWSCIRELVTWE